MLFFCLLYLNDTKNSRAIMKQLFSMIFSKQFKSVASIRNFELRNSTDSFFLARNTLYFRLWHIQTFLFLTMINGRETESYLLYIPSTKPGLNYVGCHFFMRIMWLCVTATIFCPINVKVNQTFLDISS